MHLLAFEETFLTAIATDFNLSDWAQTNFDRDIKIYAGIDDRENWPDAGDMPYIIFLTSAKRADQGQRNRSYSIEIHLGLIKTGLVKTGYDNLIYPLAKKLIGEFCELLQAAMIAALPSPDFILAITTEIDAASNPPQAYGFMDFDYIEELAVNAGEPLD